MEKLDSLKYYREFDEYVTCKQFGFETVEDYYIKSSSIQDIDQLRVPSLFINARNDLISPIDSVDLDKCKFMFNFS